MNHKIEQSAAPQYLEGNPRSCYRDWLAGRGNGDGLLLVDFLLQAYWLENSPLIPLTALYLQTGSELRVSVTAAVLRAATDKAGLSAAAQYELWSSEHRFGRHLAGSAIELATRSIGKPWGREIWYTGVEQRGVCGFVADGFETPIPWLQAAMPESALGQYDEGLVLLKILDPVAEAVTGDLYFELHEKKQEVYVVTRVDERAWPDGVGFIRMGFDPDKLESFAGDAAAFRSAYLQTVQRYEKVRREIDQLPQGVEPERSLKDRESELREAMDSYSHLQPLKIGDVVKVPLLTPHSLQHGVRTVEFQTPVYERKILSFAQKVLTQDHWDTAEAVAQMNLSAAPAPRFEILAREEGLVAERIVDFSDFEVHRISLAHGTGMEIEALRSYQLLMIIEGQLAVQDQEYGPEQALILPRGWSGQVTPGKAACPVVFLLAQPRD